MTSLLIGLTLIGLAFMVALQPSEVTSFSCYACISTADGNGCGSQFNATRPSVVVVNGCRSCAKATHRRDIVRTCLVKAASSNYTRYKKKHEYGYTYETYWTHVCTTHLCNTAVRQQQHDSVRLCSLAFIIGSLPVTSALMRRH